MLGEFLLAGEVDPVVPAGIARARPRALRRNIVTITPEGIRDLARLRDLVSRAQDDLLPR